MDTYLHCTLIDKLSYEQTNGQQPVWLKKIPSPVSHNIQHHCG